MKRFAPFLKLYMDYVKNFDKALDLVEHWSEKSPEFAKMISNLQTAVSAEPVNLHASVESSARWLRVLENLHAIGWLMGDVLQLTM